MKKVLAWGLALMMAGSLVGCSQSDSGSTSAAATEGGSEAASVSADAASGDVFTLGLIAPLSGSSAVSGQVLQNATEMAVNEINEAGGINGEIQINLVPVDDEGVPANSVTAMQRLVEQDQVNAVIGSQPSSCTMANMEITRQQRSRRLPPLPPTPALRRAEIPSSIR